MKMFLIIFIFFISIIAKFSVAETFICNVKKFSSDKYNPEIKFIIEYKKKKTVLKDFRFYDFLNNKDIFKTDAKSKLLKLIVTKIEDPDSTTLSYIRDTVSNLSYWNFEEDGLSFHFGQYTIDGLNIYDKVLTFEELDNYLTIFGKSLR